MNTKLTELLNIKYPIMQGAMAWVSDSKLAAAVSNAGGAGNIGSGGRDANWVRDEIKMTKLLTNKPFGVNVVLMDDTKDDIIDIICEEKVDFVTLSAGNPMPYIGRLKDEGIKVITVVPNLRLAKRVEQEGADAIVIEGMEAGGHIGQLTTMALMTQVLPEIDIPVIAAGGFSDGRGLAAALTMGASGIQMGTRFYASKESSAHINSKEKIVNSDETQVTGYLHNHSVRSVKNMMTEKYLELESTNGAPEELSDLVIGSSRKAPIDGDVDWGAVLAGQSLSVIKSIDSCEDIINNTMEEAKIAIRNISNLIE